MVEGGTAHGWERSTDKLVCLEVPLPPYIKEQGGRSGRPEEGAPGRRRGRRKRGPAPLSNSDQRGGAHRQILNGARCSRFFRFRKRAHTPPPRWAGPFYFFFC